MNHTCLLTLLSVCLWIFFTDGIKASDVDKGAAIYLEKAEEMLKTDPSKSIYYSNLALIEARKTNHQAHLAMGMATLGEAYMNQGDYDMAFESIYNAMENCPEENTLLLAYIYIRLTGCYIHMKDFDKAFEYIDQAAAIYEEAGDQENLAVCYNSRGLIYIQVPDNKKAEENLKAALDINRKLGQHKRVAANLNNLCLYEGNTAEKIGMLYEAIALNDSLGAVWSLGENYNNLGVQYYYAKEYHKALASLEIALTYATPIHAKELINDNYLYQSWVHSALGNYKEAYRNLLNLYEAEHEFSFGADLRQMEMNIVRRTIESKEQAMILQEQAYQIQRLRMQRYLALLIVSGIILFVIYLLYHFRQQKRIQQLETSRRIDEQEKELIELKLQQAENESKVIEKELDHHRAELTNFAFFIRSRNEMLSNIQGMIRQGYKLKDTDQEKHLRKIHTYIAQFSAKNTETELLIDQISGDFMERLSALHPDLSKNEKRLASLLKIDLTTKEIASIIDSTPKTVNMARYRLRKRMNLENDESLTEYIKRI